MKTRSPTYLAALLALMAGCASAPKGPSIMALPGDSKSFEQFRADDTECRQYADYQTGTAANKAGVDAGVTSAAVGTAVGAIAGAAFGGHRGAAAGAGAGLLIGSASGADAEDRTANRTQRTYDNAYIQCMYAKGEKVPVSGDLFNRSKSQASTYSSGAYTLPPPPSDNPPPASPDYVPEN